MVQLCNAVVCGNATVIIKQIIDWGKDVEQLYIEDYDCDGSFDDFEIEDFDLEEDVKTLKKLKDAYSEDTKFSWIKFAKYSNQDLSYLYVLLGYDKSTLFSVLVDFIDGWVAKERKQLKEVNQPKTDKPNYLTQTIIT